MASFYKLVLSNLRDSLMVIDDCDALIVVLSMSPRIVDYSCCLSGKVVVGRCALLPWCARALALPAPIACAPLRPHATAFCQRFTCDVS